MYLGGSRNNVQNGPSSGIFSTGENIILKKICFSGQQSPKPPPPQITNFLNHDLINPEQVKFNRPNALILPCGAIGSNLKWIWKHNETLIPDGILQFGNMRLSDDGTLTGSNLGITNSGTYQCFVKDTATNVQTFSRKIKVAVTGKTWKCYRARNRKKL